jgi:GTPase
MTTIGNNISGSNLPRIAIVGRPNVGKSSLFNRIAKARKTIVYQDIGTTRDRISQELVSNGRRFILTDTGGFVPEDVGRLLTKIKEQIKKAIDESDILLFVCDGQSGPLPQDFELTEVLRKSRKKIFLVVNKMDNEKIKQQAPDFYQLGMGKPYPVSALHNLGIGELLADVTRGFHSKAAKENKIMAVKVAIVGRPNVGKSSFLNRLLNEERSIVDAVPGTTRDAIDTHLKDGDDEFILIDTAGLRHKRKIKEAVDVYSIMRTKDAIARSDICLVLIDAYDGLVLDDIKILDLVLKEGKCCILCVNKWDLIERILEPKYKDMIYERAVFLRKYPVLFTSTKTRYNVYGALRLAKEIIDKAGTHASTPSLNKLLTAVRLKGPFRSRRNRLKMHYMTQTKTTPPTFLIFVNNAGFVSEEQKNFIENLIRDKFGFFGSPIELEFRVSKGGKI